MRMDIEFDGLLRLLGEHLYSDKRVFIRELVQNAHDSIVRRRHADSNLAGRIDIEAVPSQGRVSVRDNGLGMSRDDLISYLSTIAASASRRARSTESVEEVIGQHGIGFLSAFVVARSVEVHTRKVGSQDGLKWINSGGIEYEIEDSPRADIGTTVNVTVDLDQAAEVVSESEIRSIVRKYADFLPIPIFLNGSGKPINLMHFPWDTERTATENRTLDIRIFLEKLQRDSVLEVIPFSFTSPTRAQGAIYLTRTRVLGVNYPRDVRVYQNRMLLTDRGQELLPTWAIFANGVVDTPDLSPNAARDDYVRNAASETLTEALGDLIVTHFTTLSKSDPERFQEIVTYHNLGLMAACYYHSDFFDRFFHLLLFRTNAAPFRIPSSSRQSISDSEEENFHSLNEILDAIAESDAVGEVLELRIVVDGLSVRQFFRMADAAGALAIDASGLFTEELLRRVESLGVIAQLRGRGLKVTPIETAGERSLFKPPIRPRDDAVCVLAEFFDHRSRFLELGSRLRIEAVRILPAEVVAVVRASAALAGTAEEARRLISDPNESASVKAVARELLRRKANEKLQLLLNAENELIVNLAHAHVAIAGNGRTPTEAEVESLAKMLLPVYYIAVMNSQSMMPQAGREHIANEFTGMLSQLLSLKNSATQLERRAMEAEAQLRALTPTARAPGEEHISFFYITPYSTTFHEIRDAVRSVVEDRWGCELVISSDMREEDLLLDNIRFQIEAADGFIADITGLNPNVLFELGAALFTKKERPVVLLQNGVEAESLPADLEGLLRVDYSAAPVGRLVSFLDSEIRKTRGVDEMLKDVSRPRVVGIDVVRRALQSSGFDTQQLDLQGLVRSLRTEQQWRRVSDSDIRGLLPRNLGHLAGLMRDSVLRLLDNGNH